MDYEILKTQEPEQGIMVVTISRPEALNALNTRFFDEMDNLIANLKERNAIKVLVITGEGKAFVAGADIAEMVNMNQDTARAFSVRGHKTFATLEDLAVPVIAAINGYALGGGCELAMACDFRIASTKAKFGQPEVNLGLTPGYGGTQRLPRIVGLSNALYLLMTADMISAQQALQMGLVQKVVEPEQLMNTTMEIAKNICSKGPEAIKKVKKLARQGILNKFSTGCEMEIAEFASLFENEGTEGMKAFLEKRKPQW